jgi:hypothetical protein
LLLWDGESELGFVYLKFCLRCVGDLGSIDFSFRYYIDPGVRRFFHTIAEIVETYHQKQSTETIASAQRSHTSRDRTDNTIAAGISLGDRAHLLSRINYVNSRVSLTAD